MDKVILVLKVLMNVFLLICIGVHIWGLMSPVTSEPVYSHVIHLVSYSVCLVSLTRPFLWARVAYTIGAVYPFIYHARCVWEHYETYHRLSPVCILVVVLLPVGMLLIGYKEQAKA